MERLNFDVFKRQTKNKRVEEMIKSQKVKINEDNRLKTFNRLINDANRRLQSKIEISEVNTTGGDTFTKVNKKKYKKEEWSEIYASR